MVVRKREKKIIYGNNETNKRWENLWCCCEKFMQYLRLYFLRCLINLKITQTNKTFRNKPKLPGCRHRIPYRLKSRRRLIHSHSLSYCYTLHVRRKKAYTGCPRRKGPNFGRVFLRSNYTDITQNTYIQSSMVTEILAREV